MDWNDSLNYHNVKKMNNDVYTTLVESGNIVKNDHHRFK